MPEGHLPYGRDTNLKAELTEQKVAAGFGIEFQAFEFRFRGGIVQVNSYFKYIAAI